MHNNNVGGGGGNPLNGLPQRSPGLPKNRPMGRSGGGGERLKTKMAGQREAPMYG